MQKPQGAGKIINLTCNDPLLPAFPELHFGTHSDGNVFFDATFYLQTKSLDQKFNIEDFFQQYKYPIQSIVNVENRTIEELVCINNEGHQLINGCLCYLFISYVDPQFCVYISDVMNELFVTGFVISDTHLIYLIRNRLSPELLNQIWKDDTNME